MLIVTGLITVQFGMLVLFMMNNDEQIMIESISTTCICVVSWRIALVNRLLNISCKSY